MLVDVLVDVVVDVAAGSVVVDGAGWVVVVVEAVVGVAEFEHEAMATANAMGAPTRIHVAPRRSFIARQCASALVDGAGVDPGQWSSTAAVVGHATELAMRPTLSFAVVNSRCRTSPSTLNP